MSKKIFLGFWYDKYRMVDSESFHVRDYTFEELQRIKRFAWNWHLGYDSKRNSLFVPDDGLVYGVKSNNSTECMNTYTIVGSLMGGYILVDFYNTEMFLLRQSEILRNKYIFARQQITNAALFPRSGVDGQYQVDVVPYNAGFINVVSECSMQGRDRRLDGLKFLKRAYELRKDTILNGKFQLDKIGNYNIRILDSNIAELDAVLNDSNKQVYVDLQKLMRCERVGKPMIDTYFINKSLYDE